MGEEAAVTETDLIRTAAVTALIIGNFTLIGKAVKVGTRVESGRVVYRIAWRSPAMLLFLLVLTAVEELVVGLVKGQALAETIAGLADGAWLKKVAGSVVMLLVLIPMIAFEEVDRVLGDGSLRLTLLGRD